MAVTEHTTKLAEQALTREVALLFPRQGEWTERDYWALPESKRIIELSEGRLVVPDMPTTEHQDIVLNIYVALRAYIRANKLGKVSVSPLPVRLWEGKIREPDVMVMLRNHLDRVQSQFWGPPDLAVEVLSPGTQATDRGEKLAEYAQAGVGEYWIVTPEARTVEVYHLEGTTYQQAVTYKGDEGDATIMSRVLPGFALPLTDVFAEA
jgi:Uma2 family endonuclease